MAKAKLGGFFKPNKFKVFFTLVLTLSFLAMPIFPDTRFVCISPGGIGGCPTPPSISGFEMMFDIVKITLDYTTTATVTNMLAFLLMFPALLTVIFYFISCVIFFVYGRVRNRSGA